ncbi:outer membrane heme receptor [Gluconacetobacter sp. SXCC-1]|uniref:TonB-dependent receptor n=1 Tax=Komagataeibacter rhaeticus TaxID=215221 RepID=UPI000207FA6B|nr:TonB-dependent receptor [Komagataeibacter rhaeticus]ATU71502.1 heme receptor [Komagataeibacter xylinus]EGG78066.1 outer membrane heme receptor [Gluconacetobacter sp. SXCC-1]
MRSAETKKIARRRLALLSTILVATPGYGWAKSNQPSPSPVRSPPPASHTVAHQKPVAGKPPVARAQSVETLGVVGRRTSHGAQTFISNHVFATAVAGTSVLKVLQNVPGVLFQSDDAQGVDTGGVRLYVHGFSQNQIGFSLDGIPLGESVYRNYNGLNAVAALSSENVGHMDMSQGAGAVDMPSTNVLGGAIRITSSDPKDKFGGTVAGTGGSNSTTHAYIRLDSGKLNSTGTKFYVSYMRNDTKLWKGYGNQFFQQVNLKLVQPIREESSVSLLFDWADVQQFNYQAESLEMVQKLGYNVSNYYPNYRQAYLAAQGIYSNGENRTSDPKDVAYYAGTTESRDLLGGLNFHFKLAHNLEWDSVVYGHNQVAHTQWSDPWLASANGAPLSEIVKQPTIQRFGLTSGLKYRIGKHEIHGGIWYENNKYVSNMYAYNDPLLSGSENLSPSPFRKWSDPFAQLWGQTYNTNTMQTYIEDTYRPIKNLLLHAGFKSMLSTTHVGATANYEPYTGTDAIAGGVGLTTFGAFLPHFSGDWHFLKQHEFYFDIAKNMRAYPESGYHLSSSPFAVSQTAFDLSRSSIKPETSWSYSVGYRFNQKYVSFSVSAYRVNFSNRLGAITAGSQTNPQTTVLNLGSVSMNGVDAGLTLRPVRGLSIFNSVSYNHSTYDNNVTEQGTTYYTKGKHVVNYPRFMYKATAEYNYRKASFNVDATYTSSRPFSYTNDTSLPGYWLVNLGARYNFGSVSRLTDLTLSFNITNLTGSHYLMMMGDDGGNPMSGDYQSLVVGAPRQFFGGVKANF